MENKNLQQALEFSLDKVSELMIQFLFENGSVVTGALAKSIQNDNGVVKDQTGKLIGELSMLYYGKDVNEGFRFRGTGGLPPERPIRDWIQRKRITRPAKFKNERSWIWAIRMNIAKKMQGRTQKTKAYPFVERAFERANPYIRKELNRAGYADLEVTINGYFGKYGATLTI